MIRFGSSETCSLWPGSDVLQAYTFARGSFDRGSSVRIEQPMTKELIAIQYLRGAAALMVVINHLLSSPRVEYLLLPTLGQFGVKIFFVISGFIMWRTTAASDVSPPEFWRRRIIRVVPLDGDHRTSRPEAGR